MWNVHHCRCQALILLLILQIYFQVCQAIPLDDTLRNGHWEDAESQVYSAVHEAIISSHPSISAAPLYLSLDQHIQAPELTNPPRMPECFSSRKVTKALAAAINDKYGGQLQLNASIDTTYVQMLTNCDYSSFITLSGPEEVRTELVDAANSNKLCDLLPQYCSALNLSPTSVPSSRVAAASMASPVSTPPANQAAASQPIDDQRQRGIQRRRSSISSTETYLLISSSGTDNPELPPVLNFKCVKHNFTQVLTHFEPSSDNGGDSGYARAAASRRLQMQQQATTAEKAARAEGYGSGGSSMPSKPPNKDGATGTFNQVYWVCDSAWPKDHHEQKHSGNVIVFLGNESPLGIPKQPIVFENARRLNALVVLVEHRYYGESLPYPEPQGARVPTVDYRWLKIEEVIEDTASVVQHVRRERGVPDKVPNIVIGGSYGGMIASYHRVVRPDVFDAAVAASAPIYYIADTKMWRHTSNRYHQFIEDAANTMSGSTQCSDTIRKGIDHMLELGDTAQGREEIADVMHLCGTAATTLPDKDAVSALENDVIGTFQGLAQVNNQPPVLGEMAIACEVVNNATAAGQSPLAAIATLYTYMGSNGSSHWCYNFTYDPRFTLLPDVPTGYNSYTYQCCAEATVYSSELPAKESDSTMNPEPIPVPVREIEYNCLNIFGKHVPELRGPSFARHIMTELKEYGNVVFTNGDLDGWAGGSVGVLPAAERTTTSSSSSTGGGGDDGSAGDTEAYPDTPSSYSDLDNINGGLGKHSHVAFVVYRNASHCTDTHTNTWNTPNEPPEWKKQRALAMDYAAAFGARSRKRAYSSSDDPVV